MTPEIFQEIRRKAGLSLNELGAILGYADERTLRRMETGERDIPRPVAIVMSMIDCGELPDRFRDPTTIV